MTAELAALPISKLLFLPVDTRGLGPRALARAKAHCAAATLLLECAPALARWTANAVLEEAMRRALMDRLATLSPPEHRVGTHRAIDHVISIGNAAGHWQVTGIGAIAQHALAPSLVRREDAPAIAQAARWRRQLADRLPALLASADPRVLAGTLMASAVLFDALLVPSFVHDLPTLSPSPTQDFLRTSHSAWVAFGYMPFGQHEAHARRRCRRWLLGSIAAQALRRFQSSVGEKAPAIPAESALAALRAILGTEWPTSVKSLLAAAKPWWAMHLSPVHFSLATRREATESLPDTTVERLLGSVRLPSTRRPDSRRASLRDAATTSRHACRRMAAPPRVDQREHLAAYRALVRSLGCLYGHAQPTNQELRERLDAWSARYSEIGGWTEILGAWVSHLLFEERLAGRGRTLRRSSVRRYLSSFAPLFLVLLSGSDPATIDEFDALAALEQLRSHAAILSSAVITHRALAEFLLFAETHFGTARIDLVDAWGLPPRSGCPDANLLTPVEYRRVLLYLDETFASQAGSYAHRRARVLTILAFRVGLRWAELATLSHGHVQIFGATGQEQALVQVRNTLYGEPKSPYSYRRLQLSHYLPQDEYREVLDYLRDARLGRLLGSDATETRIFADPGAPLKPPNREDTHGLIQSAMRKVTGDASMVFHHLRHSAGTYLELRLLDGDGTRAWQRYPLANTVAGAAFDLSAGTYAQRLTGRPNDSRSHLYVMARTLGQIDPGVGTTHYVHLSEFGLHAATSACLPRLTDASAAAARGHRRPDSTAKARWRASHQLLSPASSSWDRLS